MVAREPVEHLTQHIGLDNARLGYQPIYEGKYVINRKFQLANVLKLLLYLSSDFGGGPLGHRRALHDS
ncbi:hypothetical protein D3C86_1302530 [compost metagenome]